MGLEKTKVLLFLLLVVSVCEGVVYKVGDSAGWTPIGNVDYDKWASSKTFKVGDTIVFEYDPRYHNVLQVSRADYHACDTTSPMVTYATGNDSVTIKSHGHYYFICGFVGHCQAGLKVDCRVAKTHKRHTVAPSPSPVPEPQVVLVPQASSPGSPLASGPIYNSGQSLVRLFSDYGWMLMGLIWILCC